MNLDKKFDIENVNRLLEKYKNFSEKSVFNLKQVMSKYGEHAEFCLKNKVNLGFHSIDSILYGIQPGEVAYFVSSTDVGKTSLAMQILKNNLSNSNAIIPFFSLENNEFQIFERVIMLETGLPFWELQKTFNEPEVFENCKKIANNWDKSVIHIVKRVTLNEIVPYIKVCEELTGKRTKFVMIDYAQLIKTTQQNEYVRVSDIAQTLKEVSLELRLPLIVISQTSRINAKEGLDLYSAKGSGEIENSCQIYFTIEKVNEVPVKQLWLEKYLLNPGKRVLKLKAHKLKRSKLAEIYLTLDLKHLRIEEIGENKQTGF